MMLTTGTKKLAAALAVLLAGISLSGCGQNAASPTASGAESVGGARAEQTTSAEITLNGSSATADGAGATVKGSAVIISEAGTYQIHGSLDDGQILVDAAKTDAVTLILDGVSIASASSAGIYAKQAASTTIVLSDGTENTVDDAAQYVYESGEDEPDAAVFAKDDLTITGGGALTVTGNFNNGIGCKDNLLIEGGSISVTAVNDALRGRDSVTVTDGEFDLTARGDGIQSNNDEDAQKGYIRLSGGTFRITAGNDGVQAETSLEISGGDYTISAGEGSQGASQIQPAQEGASDSRKGLKAGTALTVSGGTFDVDSADDAVHSNGSLTVSDGDFTVSTGDDAFHADEALTIDGGNILIRASYEGLEGATVDVNGGDVRLTASDDGVNAAGGSDSGTPTGRFGPDSFGSAGNYYVRVSGGFLSVDAGGDGIDANGALYISGGVTIINGPTDNGNGALDYDGVCEVTGGVLAAADSGGMAQAPGNDSSQNSLVVYFTEAQAAGTLVNLSDAQGNSVLTVAPSKAFQSVTLSAPELQQGQTYTVSTGGNCEGEPDDGYYGGGAYSGGTELVSVTLSGAVTRISSDGSEPGVGMGGFQGPGGGRGMPGRRRDGMGAMPPSGQEPPSGAA